MIPWSAFTYKNFKFQTVTAPRDGIKLQNIYSLSFFLAYWKEFRRGAHVYNAKFAEGPFCLDFMDIRAYKEMKV